MFTIQKDKHKSRWLRAFSNLDNCLFWCYNRLWPDQCHAQQKQINVIHSFLKKKREKEYRTVVGWSFSSQLFLSFTPSKMYSPSTTSTTVMHGMRTSKILIYSWSFCVCFYEICMVSGTNCLTQIKFIFWDSSSKMFSMWFKVYNVLQTRAQHGLT